ncbi:MAG: UDP-N-acetylmuramoyl-tripeptide--D-alanyl-D-alanine ligase [Raineya sp.]
MSELEIYELFLQHGRVSTDTRNIETGSIFFSLKGANFNGNAFAKEALQKGAAWAIIDDARYQAERCILVDNVLETLQNLARLYRRSFNIPFIAIGGSNGKTTTKELTAAVLSQKYKTFATKGNLNNHIGVPLTLLSIPQDTQMAVIELGANHIGETRFLCQIAEPNFGVLTNVGLDHLEGFGNLEGVAKANGELYEYLLENQGKIFYNTQEDSLKKIPVQIPDYQTITYPSKGDYFHVEHCPSDLFLCYLSENQEQIRTRLIGKYNFANIATALCIGKYFEVESNKANAAIANYSPSNNRSQLIEKESNTIILDAYNANPSSMQEAVKNFAAISQKKKAVILGQMNELGEYSQQEHQNLGKLLAQYDFDKVILFGEEMQAALPFVPKAYFFTDKFSLHNWLADSPIVNSIILIKGSRGVKMESVVEFL